MGRRLRLLWQLGGGSGDQRPEVVVAPIKAVLQRLGPWRTSARPVVVSGGDRVVVDELVAQLVGLGYRRESLVEHRGELAVRGGIVDVFPSTADEPVRIDLWGDEVDRLTRFDVSDQRSVDDLDSGRAVRLPGADPQPVGPDRRRAPGGGGAVGAAAVGAAGRGRAVRRYGVVAAVVGRGRGAPHRPAGRRRGRGHGRAPAGPRPGRRAPRRGGGVGRGPGLDLGTGGRGGGAPPPPALRPAAGGSPAAVVLAGPLGRRPRRAGGGEPGLGAHPGRRRPAWPVRWRPWSPTGTRWSCARRAAEPPDGWPASWPPRGSPSRWWSRPTTVHRPTSPGLGPASWWPRWTGASCCPARRWRYWPSRTSPAGVGPTARPGPGPARWTASSTTWPRGATWSTASTGWPGTGAWSPAPWAAPPATTCCSSTGATTSSTCPPTRSSC